MSLRKEIRANPAMGYLIYTRLIAPLKSYLNQKLNEHGETTINIDDIYDEEDIFRFIADTSFATIKSKHRRIKASKLPWNKVKRSRSGYMYFTCHMRSKVVEENPGISACDSARELAKLWNKATTEEKEPFEEMARKDRERYLKEREDAINEYNRHRIVKPKKSRNAWTYFMMEDKNRETVTLETKRQGKSALTIYHELWCKLSPEEQSVYEKMAEEDKIRYQKEQEEYLEQVRENRKKKMGLESDNDEDEDELIVHSDDDISEFQDNEEEEETDESSKSSTKSSKSKKPSKKASKTMNLKMEEDDEAEDEDDDEDELEIDE